MDNLIKSWHHFFSRWGGLNEDFKRSICFFYLYFVILLLLLFRAPGVSLSRGRGRYFFFFFLLASSIRPLLFFENCSRHTSPVRDGGPVATRLRPCDQQIIQFLQLRLSPPPRWITYPQSRVKQSTLNWSRSDEQRRGWCVYEKTQSWCAGPCQVSPLVLSGNRGGCPSIPARWCSTKLYMFGKKKKNGLLFQVVIFSIERGS